MTSAFLVVLLAVGLTSDVVNGLEGNPTYTAACPAAYKAIDPHHTMCLTKGPGTPVAVDSNDIVAYHNQLRAGVSDAADLFSVYWDAEVAKVAQHWATQCKQYGAHDKERSVPTLPGVYIGQNMAYGFRSWRAAIDGWWSEVKDFKYGVGSTNGNAVGHYTQAVSKDVYRIGCAQANCNGVPHYACNYVTGQHSEKPYTKGTPCSACPNHCNSQGLCDCGGLMCKNKGTLQKSTCTCKCQNNTQGTDCGKVVCPEKDVTFPCGSINTGYCGKRWTGTEHHFEYVCPNLCGLCDVPSTSAPTTTKSTTTTTTRSTTTTTPRKTTTSPTTTTTTETTTTTDATVNPCASCPTTCMSGRCPPCGGLVCKNGGVFKKETCTCKCRRHTSGSDCSTLTCPAVDPNWCENLKTCRWTVYKYACPIKCGVCKNPGTGQNANCMDDWRCPYFPTSWCQRNIYLNGKRVSEICPRHCGSCV